jgi:hypothetical protein
MEEKKMWGSNWRRVVLAHGELEISVTYPIDFELREQ